MDVGTWGATATEVYESEQSILHLPRDVRGSRITVAFYKDYIAVVRAIDTVLDKPGLAGVPSAANVEGELRGQAPRFFGKGGKVEHAMDYVLQAAMEQSPLGDGTRDDMQREIAAADDPDPDAVAYAAMPICDNDLAFADVAERLELDTVGRFRASERQYGETDDFPHDDAMEGIEDADEDDMELEDRRIMDSIVEAL